MNELFEKISWMPRNILLQKALKKKNRVTLHIDKGDKNKKTIFHVAASDKGLSSELKAFGFREPINSKMYIKFISKKDIVLDIGANIGYFTILSSKAKKIIAVEPLKECISLLEKNIKENGLEKKLKILNYAVGKEGFALFHVSERLNHSKISNKKEEKNLRKIKSKPIDYFIKRYKVNVLRMDLEGYEYDLLYKKDLSKINKISLEYHTGIIGLKKTKKLLEHLEKEGFMIRDLIDELPLRLYPFYNILKKTKLLKKFITVRKNIQPTKAYPYFLEGRSVKHINFERVKR